MFVFRAEIALTDGRLMGVTTDVNTTAEQHNTLRYTLSVLERELRDINTTVAHKQQLIDDYLSSGFAGRKLSVKSPCT